ncbi:LuxR C-terminal-related transcriptional regulator [Streptomyces sp. NBS 14/10]|uniref:helix-turn-helix transcriptional regulator n=1 Tax=Streptomyces sp. NBS 14/10 TaxID=1945643 RepID=UPI00211AD3CC|nr:LuxR C-terminal-related transcriptional regulator [Streptomyces sp. NBS 14/10]KAK1179549.1 LuxR C-terminal-related transcriptional regulator [Streptomyces sp. NBS 14/10]
MRGAIRAEPQTGADHLEQTLGQALHLLESAVRHHRRATLACVTADLPVEGEAVAGWVARLVLRAEEDVIWSLPEVASDEHAKLTAQTFAQLLDKGVRVRLLCPQAVIRGARWQRTVGELGPRVEVRVSSAVRQELVVVDGAAVIAPDAAPGEPGGSRASMIQNSTVADMLYGLLCGMWDAAQRPTRPLSFEGGARGRVLREVLTLMAEGYKDDAAARKLGLSVRTYRRYVADIMRDLRVESRFQAGVRAVRAGLMEPYPE